MVAAATDTFDLGRLRLASGEGRRFELDVTIEPLDLTGQVYASDPPRVRAVLDVDRTTTGWSLRLRYEVQLTGACMRCLEGAGMSVAVDAREIDQPGGGEDLDSPYVDGDRLDLRAWTRDALVLALPGQIVCRPDCLGLCPVCGKNLNEAAADHGHEPTRDPRWAKLDELKLD